MYDVIYFGYHHDDNAGEGKATFIKEVSERFKDAILEDADDDIKGIRLTVKLPEEEADNYNAWIIAHGWFQISLTLKFIMMSPDKKGLFHKTLALAQEQYPECFKQREEEK